MPMDGFKKHLAGKQKKIVLHMRRGIQKPFKMGIKFKKRGIFKQEGIKPCICCKGLRDLLAPGQGRTDPPEVWMSVRLACRPY